MADRNATNTPDFDLLARVYRWMEYLSFGPMLERCRFHFLHNCTKARQALVLGDGDGRFSARLLAINSGIHIDAVDASAAMLAQLERRARKAAPDAGMRLQAFHADVRNFVPNIAQYDFVASHFFLDCLTEEEIANLIQRILPHLTPDATWLISEFATPEKGWQRPLARGLVRFLYLAFEIMTHLHARRIPDYAGVLASNGFRCQQQEQLLGGLLVAEVWEWRDK